MRFLIPLILPLGLVGCNDPTPYGLAPISGIVTLDGRPVVGAVVTFQPMSTGAETVGPGSTGHCDAQGRYELATVRGEPGAVVAPHRVTIFPPRGGTNPADYAPGTNIDTMVVSPATSIPDRYNYQTTLSFEVDATGSSSADFRLTTDP